MMKKLFLIVSIATVTLLTQSCGNYRFIDVNRGRTAGNSGKVPPGQAKKMYGKKSGKYFAPGQRKKRY